MLTSGAIIATGCLDRPVASTQPLVSARVVEKVRQNKVSKIDLLFMIDNSSSMADKQAILQEAVPQLVRRLVEPKCVNETTGQVEGDPVMNQCAKGVLDFEPIKDIHIGIITSSLGGHGAPICEDNNDGRSFPHNNDNARLVRRNKADETVPTFGGKGFLLYNPSAPGGLKTVNEVVEPFRTMVEGVGQHGCGYEASLESIYRFLIDPEPFKTLELDTSIGGKGQMLAKGIDQELLAQRAAFLRPDSLVSIMIVTDENDCSIVDGGQGFYPLETQFGGPSSGTSIVRRGTSACLTNPNDACCFNCGVEKTPTGCMPAKEDAECKKDEVEATMRREADDPSGLRCFNQKKKYGQSFLYPVERYIDGFTKPQIAARSGKVVQNPLFSDLGCQTGTECTVVRDESFVFVAGITGVPWQLLSKNPNDLTAGYKSAEELHDSNVWPQLIGDAYNPSGPIQPGDKHMIESVEPRAGLPTSGSSETADPIHGHEWETSRADQPFADLQYACTFELPQPKTCTSSDDCDCGGTPDVLAARKNPLCQNGTTFSNSQRRAKAYPGTRILEVLKGLDPKQAIVASICPANMNAAQKDANDYGYTPAIQALLSRLRTVLRGRCLPRSLDVDAEGKVHCVVVEAYQSGGTCDCTKTPGREAADPEVITDDMYTVGDCFCEIPQLEGAQQEKCKTNLDPGAVADIGWCYVDPIHTKDGNPDPRQCDIVSKCGATERRLIKFANPASEPIASATAFIMCQERAFDSKASQAALDVCKK
jgi:hypothetical protein